MNSFLEDSILRLRALDPEDMALLYKWENDTSLWKYGSTLAPYSKYVIRQYIEDSTQDIFTTKQLRLMLDLKGEQRQTIGTIDMYDFDPHNRRAGVGVLIDTAFQKRGYAEKALLLFSSYAFEFLSLNQLYAHIPVSNIASIRLFEKCGYEIAGLLKCWQRIGDNYEDVHILQNIRK